MYTYTSLDMLRHLVSEFCFLMGPSVLPTRPLANHQLSWKAARRDVPGRPGIEFVFGLTITDDQGAPRTGRRRTTFTFRVGESDTLDQVAAALTNAVMTEHFFMENAQCVGYCAASGQPTRQIITQYVAARTSALRRAISTVRSRLSSAPMDLPVFDQEAA